MVLSNKKLKQKLRSLVAVSLEASESANPSSGHAASSCAGAADGEELQSLRLLLGSKSQKPSFSNKVKKRKGPYSSDKLEKAEEEEEKDEDDKECKGKERKKGRNKENNKSNKKERKRKKMLWEIKREKKQKRKERISTGEDNNHVSSDLQGSKAANVDMLVIIEESEYDPKKVYVGGIPYYSTEDDIRSYFEGCGTVAEVDRMTFPESGKFRGIAFLTLKTEAAAKRALALDGADMGGFYLKVQPYKRSRIHKPDFVPKVLEGYNRIYVGNLFWDVTEDDLRKLFSDCNISAIRFGKDKETGDFKGYAHVDFSDSVSLMNALERDQEVVCGRPVRIRCAVAKTIGKHCDPKKIEDTLEDASSKEKKIVPNDKEVDASIGNGGSKKKRRTCYECGVPGHLGSECPSKKVVAVDQKIEGVEGNTGDACSENKRMTSDGCINLDDEVAVGGTNGSKVNDSTDNGGSKKKKRRTGNECGVHSHLGADCTSKEVITVDQKIEDGTGGYETRDEEADVGCMNGNKVNDCTGNGGPRKKKKRKTCYECGVPGHIGSDCPSKKLITVDQKIEDRTGEYGTHDEEADVGCMNGNKVNNSGTGNGSSRKKTRKTCYECGVPGHIGSDCPSKKAATVIGSAG